MLLKAMRLGKNNSGYIKKFKSIYPPPLLVFQGNLVKSVLKHVSKNGFLQIYERPWKHVQIECVRECLSLLSFNMYNLVP